MHDTEIRMGIGDAAGMSLRRIVHEADRLTPC